MCLIKYIARNLDYAIVGLNKCKDTLKSELAPTGNRLVAEGLERCLGALLQARGYAEDLLQAQGEN